MRRSVDFNAVVRGGARSRRGRLVVHLQPSLTAGVPPRIGLVVGKSVGGSVVRHRVARRLRHQLAERVRTLPAGSGLVVRALPESATATSAQFGADLDAALARLLDPAQFASARGAGGRSQPRAQGPSERASAHRAGRGVGQ